MARSGTSVGTVVRWDDATGTGLVDLPEVPGDCWVDASAIDPRAGGSLRAGQIVEVDWTETPGDGRPLRADRLMPRNDLQGTPGA